MALLNLKCPTAQRAVLAGLTGPQDWYVCVMVRGWGTRQVVSAEIWWLGEGPAAEKSQMCCSYSMDQGHSRREK